MSEPDLYDPLSPTIEGESAEARKNSGSFC